ncbi:hypothetical protein IKE71_01250 [Candidatus Saccharibacteria bacterium]|nr:hypothetical protein [Candidatus Saccharibacteria bacterium]
MQNLKEINLINRALRVSLASFGLFILGFCLVPTLISEASATTTSVGAAWNAVSLRFDPDVAATSSAADPEAEQALSTHGDVLFGDIVPTSTDNIGNLGTMRVIKKTLGVETTGQYYSVYLSMSGDSNRLLLNNTNMYIEPTSGTWDNPAAFTGSSWGYAVPTGNTTAGTFITPFSTPAIYNNYDTLLGRDLTKTGTGSSVYNTGLWAAIPVNDTDVAPQQIWKAETSNTNGFGGELGDSDKDHFDIYFAAIIDTNVMAGTYENSIIYTAIASSQNLDSASSNLSRSLEYVGEGSEEVLSFDLSASTSAITQDQVKVYLVPHYIVEHSNYTITDDYAAYKVAANTCTITSLTTTSADATVTCTLPASPNGIDDGITAEDTITYNEGKANEETVTIEKGEFDLWVNIESYGYNYISRYTKELDPIASIVYAGLQSTDANGDAYITEMQEMKGYICSQTNEWGTTLGAEAELYNYEGMDADAPTNLATGAAANTLGLGTFALKDNRDENSYLVRRLADENCWMVQNLALDLSTIGTLDESDTNISGSWTPDAQEIVSSFAGATTPRQKYTNGYYYYNFYAKSGNQLDNNNDICPKGWTARYSAVQLASKYGIDMSSSLPSPFLQIPMSFDVTGYLYPDDKIYMASRDGNYWVGPNRFEFNNINSSYSVSGSDAKNGFSVRCVARD